MLKMVLVVPRHLGMSPGKVASQVAHVAASLGARCAVQTPALWAEYEAAPVKLVLQVRDEAALFEVASRASRAKLPVGIFVDAPPTTEGTEGKVTALGIGPAPARRLDAVTGKLKLYK